MQLVRSLVMRGAYLEYLSTVHVTKIVRPFYSSLELISDGRILLIGIYFLSMFRATLPVVSLAIPSLGRSGSLYDDLPTDGSCTSSWAASPAEIEMDISNNDSDDEIDRRKKQKTGGIGTKVSKDRGDFLRKSTTVEDKLER